MASLHVACGSDEWPPNKTPVPRILLNNNYDLSVDPCGKKPKCCALLCKENTLASRTRSKSESQCKWLNSNSNEFHRNRTYTYSDSVRSMHDKPMNMNVCVVPNNVQDLLLDGYQKTDLNWQNGVNGAKAPEKFDNEQPLLDQVPLNDSFSTIYKHDYDFNQRERLVGVKRSREKSPNLVDTTNNDGVPIKISSRTMLETEYQMCNGVTAKHCRVRTPSPVHRNGLSEHTNGTSKHIPEFLDSSACKCDPEHSPSVKLKNQQNESETNSLNEESVTETFHEAGEETEEECECYKGSLEAMSINNFEHHDENHIHSGLRMSLFPNVPPYVKFSTHDVKGEQFPIHIHKLLRWKLSNITPVVVRKVVANSGYRLLKKSTYWGGTWGKHTRSVGFRTLYDYQKMNHFPGTFQIGRKDRLWKSMQKLMLRHGKSKFDLMPTTYILPQDKKQLRLAWKKNTCKEQPWIVKPPASARGTGIKVVHKWNQIPENTPVIVQKYISNPFLINDTKFDLRLYVLVTSMNPLRIYLYDNGLVRFASVKYSTEVNTLADRYMHLTNYSINKLSSKYKQNEDAHACQGHKWTLKTLWSYMERELNVNVSKLWSRLIDLVIKTIISGEFTVNQLSNSNLGSRYNSYELFGIDVLFDSDLKPWLLEVNISPSLHSSSPLDLAVKAPMVYDLMNIAGFQIPSSKKFTEEQLAKDLGNLPVSRLCYDNRLYSRNLCPSEKYKHCTYSGKMRTEYLNKILEDLTPDDVRHLIQYEDELTQLGSFQKIFPTPSTHEYLQYFDAPRYYNMLFDAWETNYHDKREEGIELLRAKCEQNYHLKVAKVNGNSSKICEIHQKCLLFHVKNQNNPSNDLPLCLYKTPANQTKPKASFAVKPRYRSRYTAATPSKTYLLRSRKH